MALKNDFAFEIGRHYLRLRDLLCRDFEEVAIKHNDVRRFPDLERPRQCVYPHRSCGINRVNLDRGTQIDCLISPKFAAWERSIRVFACDQSLNRDPEIGNGNDRPVRSASNKSTALLQALNRPPSLGTFPAHNSGMALDKSGGKPADGADISDHTKLGEAGNIAFLHKTRMSDGMIDFRGAAEMPNGFHSIKHTRYSRIACTMDLQSHSEFLGPVEPPDHIRQGDKQVAAMTVGVRGIR